MYTYPVGLSNAHEAVHIPAVDVVVGAAGRELAGHSRGGISYWRDVVGNERTVPNGRAGVDGSGIVGLTSCEERLHKGGGGGRSHRESLSLWESELL